MSSGATRHGDREITRGFLEALRPALAADAMPIARLAARDVSQLLGLLGLEAALLVCDAHAGSRRPLEVGHLAERIARVADQAEAEGSLVPFLKVDRELRALASQLELMQWQAATEAAPAATHGVIEQLAGLTLEGADGLDDVRCTAPVAGALRAVLDWLAVDARSRTRVQVQDSALELSIRVSFPGGLAAAGAVLASVDGCIGAGADDRWALRVPLASARPSFLLLRQGHLGLALPWHAVARLRMLRSGEHTQLDEPVLPPFAASGDVSGDRPAALLAHGLRRAWFVADRIIWRIAAEPEEPETAAPVAGLSQVIRVEGGESYWIIDAAWMLRGVDPAPVPAPAARSRPSLLLGSDAVQPITAASAPTPESEDPFAALDELLPSLAPDEPAPAKFTPTVEVVRSEAAMQGKSDPDPVDVPRVRPRRALVVDDSLVARIFLGRLLEQRGFPVISGENAAELWAGLKSQEFGVVFVDVCLPDARGRAHLERVLELRARSPRPFDVVVLTRDAEDEELARAAGASFTLRKPFESAALDLVLQLLSRHSEDLH
ncbi:MAG: response regulator [Candidatus Eisenbacteria bacterium]